MLVVTCFCNLGCFLLPNAGISFEILLTVVQKIQDFVAEIYFPVYALPTLVWPFLMLLFCLAR